jgi:hypothetical protein
LAKREFRAALGFIRLAESSFTAVAYLTAGLITPSSLTLIPQILPSVLIGVPIGERLIRRMPAETFRRLCMSFDAWVVGFGASTVIRDLHIVDGNAAYLLLAAVIVVDACLLYRFFTAGAGSRFAVAAAASADLKADRQSATLH